MSKRFGFEYELHQAGWATARIRHSDSFVEMPVSYLHDSLRELATATFTISRGAKSSRVVFMDEPGEHHLTLTREEDAMCRYSIDWFNDHHSWGLRIIPGGEHICAGNVSVRRLVQQVYSELYRLHEVFGVAGYKERWVAHEFPHTEMQRLIGVSNK